MTNWISGFFKINLQAQLQAGAEGVILGGTLGEASVITTAEKELLVQTAIENAGGKPVILNIAEGSTRVALEQVKLAEQWGAQGLMLLPPMRYKSDHRETVHYFQTIANSTALPIMLYNNPVDYKTEITIAMFEELQNTSNISAVKESTRDVTNVTRMRNAFGDRFSILCGVDTLAMEELLLGADGWVAGLVCAFPVETVRLYNLVKEGRLEDARKLYRWFMPLLELDIHPKLVQYIKLAEAETGIGSEFVRAPRLRLEGVEREQILNIIREGIRQRDELNIG
ncbi:MAG: dihydrodipicolinate synthase family protein [Chitinophagaceae bacterium]|nr:dihydrodipicolinate synthase family protein [Chitinophagaceae bacterium]